MHESTKSDLIEASAGAIGSLMKEVFVRRHENQQLEREQEYRREIARLRHGDSGDGPDQRGGGGVGGDGDEIDTPARALERASTLAEEYDDLLATAESLESCDLCAKLIRAARDRPAREQRKLLPELQAFVASVDEGAERDALAAQVRDSAPLMELLQENMDLVEDRRSRQATLA